MQSRLRELQAAASEQSAGPEKGGDVEMQEQPTEAEVRLFTNPLPAGREEWRRVLLCETYPQLSPRGLCTIFSASCTLLAVWCVCVYVFVCVCVCMCVCDGNVATVIRLWHFLSERRTGSQAFMDAFFSQVAVVKGHLGSIRRASNFRWRSGMH